MLASEIVKRARSLADVPNSLFISHNDEVESMWESYKDIYSKITDSSDDYYIKETILNTTNATKLGENEWELALTDDIYKIRFVDYIDSGRWQNMDKFATVNRNKQNTRPQYRFRGDKLWIICSSWSGLPAQIRIDYYPSPVKPSIPEVDKQYCLSYTQYNSTGITYPVYYSSPNANLSDDTDYLMYILNGSSIVVESNTNNTTTTLYTGTGLSYLAYNLGYIYYLYGGNIYRATTNLTSTITPTAITSVANITNFSISKNKIYFSDGTNTYYCNLDGTNITQLYAYATHGVNLIRSNIYYIKDSDGYIYNGSTSLNISATMLSGDGTNYYYLDSASVFHKNDTEIITTNISWIGSPYGDYLPTISDKYSVIAYSTLSDTDFVYPLNEANEIMAYQCAIDFRRKQLGDITLLSARLAEIGNRFMSVLKRDEGQPEHMASTIPNNWLY